MMAYLTYFGRLVFASKRFKYNNTRIDILTIGLMSENGEGPYQLGTIYNIQQLLECNTNFDLYTLDNNNYECESESRISFNSRTYNQLVHISRRQFTLNKVIRG